MSDTRWQEAVQGAMLAFAVGDALGWPLETRGNRVGGTSELRATLDLRSWTRREGGRFAPHEEQLPVGAYSDDTQLTLAVARSLSYDDHWWDYFTDAELPWWPHYELGGGGASKRAARAWARGIAPWGRGGARGYWTAGGNGAAMRILPHCTHRGVPFEYVRRRVLADGAATHGDPLALLGGQLYAYALWMTLQRSESLRWGELLDELLMDAGLWTLLELDAVPRAWAEHVPSDYQARWRETTRRTIDQLARARDEMRNGALTIDEQVLHELGAFSEASGAGTITAVSAVYLASRHAANPQHGLLRAAFARGADTDTLAAMTGALLGALHGPGWLERAAHDVMDADLLTHVLSDRRRTQPATPYSRAAQRHVDEQLAFADRGDRLDLPFYGDVEILAVHDLDNRASHIRSWWMRNRSGQTFRVKRISRTDPAPWMPLPSHAELVITAPATTQVENGRIRSGLVVRVADISDARTFYTLVLGLDVTRETATQVVLAGWLALEHDPHPEQTRFRFADTADQMTITLYADDITFRSITERLKALGHSHRIDHDGRRLRTADFEETPIEIRLTS
ncbi:ADP-ribosylglycohydrolase family protein [Conexibacter sp. CPCC 206217]|uniref:ADP-ribosylglycohydrolase family protein n=1 Tax=Conexibacter sp. CPCC 206217 TaxID=3064574 RepID=UPI002715BD53|nr:ADP-ribosylglycohydrolase family protein [Conexibacter sp. CPCC 206217]MDO8211007.1 ADP-ribosylglycohydrolase family protein [Conexibacter sp. CPCC 206217]